MSIDKLTKEEKAIIYEEMKALERAKKARTEKERELYRNMRNETVTEWFTKLKEVSAFMLEIKKEIFESAAVLIEMKDELFMTKTDRRSDNFTNSDGTVTISLGYHVNDGWDSTVDIGIAKVKEYLLTLARDQESGILVEAVMGLLAKDGKGNLKASRVIQLSQIADKSGNADFIDGINIIRNAYRPQPTCQFLAVKFRDDQGRMHSLPLSMSAIEIESIDESEENYRHVG